MFLVSELKFKKFILWGRSMGATSCLMYSLKYQSLEKNNNKLLSQEDGVVVYQILDSPFISFEKVSVEMSKKFISIPQFGTNLILDMMKKNCSILQSYNPFLVDFQKQQLQLQNLSIPTLIIFSQRDEIINYKNSLQLCNMFSKCSYQKMIIQHKHNTPRSTQNLSEIIKKISIHIKKYQINKKKGFFFKSYISCNKKGINGDQQKRNSRINGSDCQHVKSDINRMNIGSKIKKGINRSLSSKKQAFFNQTNNCKPNILLIRNNNKNIGFSTNEKIKSKMLLSSTKDRNLLKSNSLQTHNTENNKIKKLQEQKASLKQNQIDTQIQYGLHLQSKCQTPKPHKLTKNSQNSSDINEMIKQSKYLLKQNSSNSFIIKKQYLFHHNHQTSETNSSQQKSGNVSQLKKIIINKSKSLLALAGGNEHTQNGDHREPKRLNIRDIQKLSNTFNNNCNNNQRQQIKLNRSSLQQQQNTYQLKRPQLNHNQSCNDIKLKSLKRHSSPLTLQNNEITLSIGNKNNKQKAIFTRNSNILPYQSEYNNKICPNKYVNVYGTIQEKEVKQSKQSNNLKRPSSSCSNSKKKLSVSLLINDRSKKSLIVDNNSEIKRQDSVKNNNKTPYQHFYKNIINQYNPSCSQNVLKNYSNDKILLPHDNNQNANKSKHSKLYISMLPPDIKKQHQQKQMQHVNPIYQARADRTCQNVTFYQYENQRNCYRNNNYQAQLEKQSQLNKRSPLRTTRTKNSSLSQSADNLHFIGLQTPNIYKQQKNIKNTQFIGYSHNSDNYTILFNSPVSFNIKQQQKNFQKINPMVNNISPIKCNIRPESHFNGNTSYQHQNQILYNADKNSSFDSTIKPLSKVKSSTILGLRKNHQFRYQI